ncbi:MAG: hypothetical protein D4R65_04625 [Verrucomicrobiaceae bacterium]|nr:MAG: hypothetical protein D4R65_04625 [Verrucomicrobiaceae bacterium]
MEKLGSILQEMVVRKLGKRGWTMVIQRCIACHDFEQHLESYGAQRVSPVSRWPHEEAYGADLPSGFLLLIHAAETLGETVSDLLEKVGRQYASSLPIPVELTDPFSSSTGFFSAMAFFHASCAWIFEILTPGSLRVTAAATGGLKIRCATREKDLGAFVKGFISEIHKRFEGSSADIRSDALGHLVGNTLSFLLTSSPPEIPCDQQGVGPRLVLHPETATAALSA